MPEIKSRIQTGSIVEAKHVKLGKVKVHGVERRPGYWIVHVENSKGRPKRVHGDPKFWDKRGYAQIVKAYPEAAQAEQFNLTGKVYAKASGAEIESANKWFGAFGKLLPKVFNYDRFIELLRRSKKHVAKHGAGHGADNVTVDQDWIVAALESEPSTFEREDGRDAETVRARVTEEGESSAAWDEASTTERFGVEDPKLLEAQNVKDEIPDDLGVTHHDEHDSIDWMVHGANNPKLRDAFRITLARSPIQRAAALQADPDAEVLTPAQQIARSRKGDFLEMYLLFQEGEKPKDIAKKFFKMYCPPAGGPKSWPRLVTLEPGEVRASIEYVRRWLQTIPNKANFLFEVQEELKRINKDRAWSEIARELAPPKVKRPESVVPADKKRGKQWASVGSISGAPSGGGRGFDFDRYYENLFSARTKKILPDETIPVVRKMDGPVEYARFMQSIADQVKADLTYWVDVDGRVRCSDMSVLRRDKTEAEPEPEAPEWFSWAGALSRPLDDWMSRAWALRYEPKPRPEIKDDPATARKKAKRRAIDNGLIALIDGGKLTEGERQELVRIADLALEGQAIPTIARRVKLSESTVKRTITKLVKAA
jgi:hypothetical protein